MEAYEGTQGISNLNMFVNIAFLSNIFELQVPKEWKLDPDWDGEQPKPLSHLRKFPSKWSAAVPQQDPLATVRIVDHFVIPQTEKSDLETKNGPVAH